MLEFRVRELVEANRRLKALSETKGLANVGNRRF